MYIYIYLFIILYIDIRVYTYTAVIYIYIYYHGRKLANNNNNNNNIKRARESYNSTEAEPTLRLLIFNPRAHRAALPPVPRPGSAPRSDATYARPPPHPPTQLDLPRGPKVKIYGPEGIIYASVSGGGESSQRIIMI